LPYATPLKESEWWHHPIIILGGYSWGDFKGTCCVIPTWQSHMVSWVIGLWKGHGIIFCAETANLGNYDFNLDAICQESPIESGQDSNNSSRPFILFLLYILARNSIIALYLPNDCYLEENESCLWYFFSCYVSQT
jgi:hypothetical protein